jgi:hypothetical protein
MNDGPLKDRRMFISGKGSTLANNVFSVNKTWHSPRSNLKASTRDQKAPSLFSLPRQKAIPNVFPASFPDQTPEESQDK